MTHAIPGDEVASVASLESPSSHRSAWELLRVLREAGARISAIGGRVRVHAPKGLVTQEFQANLRSHRDEILDVLRHESETLRMPLSEFAREGDLVELCVPGASQTMWWVPTSRDADELVQRGVGRGRIWTAEELRRVWARGIREPEDVLPLARLKIEFNCILEDLQAPPFCAEGKRK